MGEGSLTDASCQSTLEKAVVAGDCNLATDDEDCGIIITGGSGGPPASFIDVFVDGVKAFQISGFEEIACFDRPVAVGTRGSHQVRISGVLERDDAINASWFDPQTTKFYQGIVGEYLGLNLTSDCPSTSCGKLKPPADLLLRQVGYGGGGSSSVRASWRNGEDPYAVAVRTFINGAPFGPALPGDAVTTVLGALAPGTRTVGVQGDSGLPGGPSDIVSETIAVLGSPPFATGQPVDVACEWSASDLGQFHVTWTPTGPIDLVDVHLRRQGETSFEFLGSLVGTATSFLVLQVAGDDALRLQFFRRSNGHLYGFEAIDCGGSQGSGGQLPGDVTQDSKLNIADPIALLGNLFLGRPTSLPCDGGTPRDPGPRALTDWDGDGAVNITDGVGPLQHLFLGGPGHALGSRCVSIAGCPGRCAP